MDIKQLVKTDLEAAINGKQWPISCFGPFKDKPCIPSFIEDQSFEEIRWLCYEAKQKNCMDQYVQYFTKEAMEANNKTKTMLQLSAPVIDIICRLYDASTDAGANTGLAKSAVNNPFGLGGNVINDTTSIFNKPSIPLSGNSSFGGGFSNSSTTVGQTSTQSGGIFSGGGLAFGSQNQQSSIFSQQLQKPASIFGGGVTQGSLFGQTQTNTGIIGGLFGQTPQPTGNLFAQTTTQQQQSQPTAHVGLFGQHAQQPQSGSLFGQQNQTQTAPGGNLFNQSIQQQQQQPNGGGNPNVFAQAMQSQQTQSSSGFPMYQTNKPQTSLFGQQNVFAQQSSGGMFGQIVANTPGNNSNNLFTQPVNATDTNGIFKNPQNIFAQTIQQQQTSPNLYSQPNQSSTTTQPSSGFFQQNVQSLQMTNQQMAFAQQMGVNNSSLLQSPVVSSSVYSKLEDLTSEDIEAFKADMFTPGRVPNVPPPRELIN